MEPMQNKQANNMPALNALRARPSTENTRCRRQCSGFTVTEILIVLVVLLGVGFFAYSQWHYFSMTNRNEDRKTAINSLHYYLKEVYYPEHKSYPVTLSPENVSAISKDAFTDPSGRPITDPQSDLRYDPSQCNGSSCQSYTLRADLEQAEDFIRESNN